jgi:ABC-2 type transport system permease protein
MNSSRLADAPDAQLGRPPEREGELAFSRWTSLWTLYVLTLRQHLHGRRWMVMAGLFALSAGLVILIRVTAPIVPPLQLEFIIAFMFIPQAILPLLALVYASGIVRDEQEEQTMTYLLIRPIPKWALYLAKLFATLTTTVFLAAAMTVLLYATIYIGAHADWSDVSLRCLKAASVHSLAVATYCCLFGLISLLTSRVLIVGVLYAGFFEGFLANLPFNVRLATVIYYTRLIAYRSLSFVTTLGEGSRTTTIDIAARIWQLNVKEDPGLAQHPQIRACVTVLSAVCLFCAIAAAVLFSQREFYVKTPEKS